MNTLIVTLHVIVSIVLIIAVLLQSGKAADLAGAFGGVGSQTAFGPRGSANILSKITTSAAVIFMLTSLGLWILSAKGTTSVVGGEKAPAATTQTTQTETQPVSQSATETESKAADNQAQKTDTQPPSKPAQSPVKK